MKCRCSFDCIWFHMIYPLYLSLISITPGNAQTIYGAGYFSGGPFLSEYAPNCCNCNINFTGLLETNTGNSLSAEGGLTVTPDGSLYLSFWGALYAVDPATAICTQVPGLPVAPTHSNGLAATSNTSFYAVDEWTGSNNLWKYDLEALTLTLIGQLPYNANGGILFLHGLMYMSANEGLVLIDTLDPANSTLLFSYPPGTYVYLGAPLNDCGMVLVEISDKTALLSLLDGSLQELCDASFYWIFFARNTYQFPMSCIYTLDLDWNDSSGSTGYDFSTSYSCLLLDGAPVADEDVVLYSDDRIDHLTLDLSASGFVPDAPDEYLLLTGTYSNISVTGSGTSTITLQSTGTATLQDFRNALLDVAYFNTAVNATPGMRTVEIRFTTQAGNISATATTYIEVESIPTIHVDLGPDIAGCAGQVYIFDAGNPGAAFQWSGGETSQSISTSLQGEYTVTVSNGVHCPGTDQVLLEILPVIHLSFTGEESVCSNTPVTLTVEVDGPYEMTLGIDVNPGDPILLENITGTYTFSHGISTSTTFTLVEMTPAEPACIQVTDSLLEVELHPVHDILTFVSICAGDSAWVGTQWVYSEGFYTTTQPSIYGCDSTITTIVDLLPSVIEHIDSTTCDPSAAGIFYTYHHNPFGCDTVIVTTITLSPSDTTNVHMVTCHYADAGISQEVDVMPDGCIHLIITTTIYIPPPDTTFLFGTTCDLLLIGILMDTLFTHDGCDSIVFLTSTFAVADTSRLTTTSCDPAEIGVFETLLSNVSGCDSLVIWHVTPGIPDTTHVMLTSCDPASTGVFEDWQTGSTGCDSLIITTISFALVDSVFITSSTCDPDAAGVFVAHFQNQFGCDSILTEIITLVPSHDFVITSTSCHAQDTGVFVQWLINQYGCDSTITTTVHYAPIVHQSTANPVCDTSLAGIVETVWTTSAGCDSLVVVLTPLFPLPQIELASLFDFNGYDVRCEGDMDGGILSSVQGVPPFDFIWSTSDTSERIYNVPAGLYSMTVTDGNGCTQTGEITLTAPSGLALSFMINSPGCFEYEPGSILATANGGSPPYLYSINGVEYQSSPLFAGLMGGVYQISILDNNLCESGEVIEMEIPVRVQVDLGDDMIVTSGDTTVLTAVLNVPIDELAFVTWTGAGSIPCTLCLSQAIVPFETSTYTIDITSLDGCTDRDEVTLIVSHRSDIFIPNIFSPNGDGVNDRLSVFASQEIAQILLWKIFDRWGNMVFSATLFQANDPSVAWDGTHRNRHLNPGVYAYQLEALTVSGARLYHHGNITLIR